MASSCERIKNTNSQGGLECMLRVNTNVQNNPSFKMWTDDQVYEVHLASLEVLERTGVVINDNAAKQLLKDYGCYVKGNLVKFPASVVKNAVESAPERVVLVDGDLQRKVYLEQKSVHYGMADGISLILDPYTQEIRNSKIEDVERAAKVAETLENLSVVSPLVAVEGLSSVEHYKAVRRNTKKPLLIKCPAIDELIEILGMAQGLSGGHQEFAINPSFAVYIQSERPLELTDKDIKILKFCAENGIPVSYIPVVCPGETGPDSLAGCFVLGTATALAALIVQQLVKRGSPYIHGIIVRPQSCERAALYAEPEVALSHSVSALLGNLYRIPSFGLAGVSDYYANDQQAAMEATFTIQAAAFAGVNISAGIGNCGDVASLESMVMANEIIGMTKHFMKGVEINEETVPVDLIHEVGPGGHFLMAEHTMKYYKTATWYPRYMNRCHFSQWQRDDGKSMGEKLNLKIKEILENA